MIFLVLIFLSISCYNLKVIMLKNKTLKFIIKSYKTMENIFDFITKKMNGVIWTLVINGVILLILAILIVWYNFMVRLTIGLVVLIFAYTCFYLAYKIWLFKKEASKYLKLK